MSKEFGSFSNEFQFKNKTFTAAETNSARILMPKSADIFGKPTPLHSRETSSILERMSEGNAEIGPIIKPEAMQVRNPQPENKKPTNETSATGRPLDEETLRRQQEEDGEDLEAILKQLAEEGEIDPIMNHDELEDALGVTLTNERHGSMKHVYDVVERPDVVAKVDRSVVDPEDQEVEQDLNKFLHSFAPDQIPETIETKYLEKDGKKASLTYTRKIDLAPKGTEAAPGKKIKDLKARFEAVGLHRFLDTNVGNGVEDERTGTDHSHEVDAKTQSEVYFDDSGELIIDDVLHSRANIEQFVDNNLGRLYSREGAKKVKASVEYLQNKYDPEFKKNPGYKAQKQNQRKLVAA